MGFLNGSLTFERFRIVEDPTDAFGEGHLKKLKKFQIGSFETNLYESPAIGFVAGDHVLDTDFNVEKNIIGDAMHFGIRIDSCAIPSPIKKAWMNIELAGITELAPGSRPSKAHRQEAKEAVEARCADEADKGNFKRMSETAVLWDSLTETIFLGSTSEKSNDMCQDLLERAFGIQLGRVSAGKLAMEHVAESEDTSLSFECYPTAFQPEDAQPHVAWWNGMAENWDYLGNEFLLWLWWQWETKSDTIKLSDDSEVSGMFARTLVLDCPQGEFGKESISSDSPVTLPETAIAIRMGKLPRKAGLTLVRNGEQFDLTLNAESFAFTGARISKCDESGVQLSELEDRIESVRQLADTVDYLFEVFCQERTGKSWNGQVKKITNWLETTPPTKRIRAAA